MGIGYLAGVLPVFVKLIEPI